MTGDCTTSGQDSLPAAAPTGLAASNEPARTAVDRRDSGEKGALDAQPGARLFVQAAGIELVIAAPPARAGRLPQITGTDRVLTVRTGVRAALDRHGTAGPLPQEGAPPCRAS
ncbi:hypothetical protein [Kitasatospora sp. DSM 101779]|uniref:hypothetical protein n=1 Tax=Kitasatospora sp. DSM 101779 TaxID=2853165 RepID=UPI0021D93E43|nr:hypothetical protein [Kitasatospora sp. DSM 101779]MCU7826003.1 hypothetical protein [Kitasatospora sp. DSM 101779]